MSYGEAISFGQQAILTAFVVAAPVLILSMIVGLTISIVQAVTQIQEPTLTFIPKILVSALAILFFGPFMLGLLTDFTARMITSIPTLVR